MDAPASAAPSRATRSAARLRDDRASEPPNPTIVSGSVTTRSPVVLPCEEVAHREAPIRPPAIGELAEPRYEHRLTQKGSDLFTALNALRQWGDQYLSAKPMRLLRRKADKTPVVAALVPEGAPVLASVEIELVPGPGFPRSSTT